jgi:hypothetical protein
MRVTCLLASILIVALLLYSPATAEDSPSAMNKNKKEVGTKESEAGKDVVEKGVEKSENDVKESQEGGNPGPKEPEEVAPVDKKGAGKTKDLDVKDLGKENKVDTASPGNDEGEASKGTDAQKGPARKKSENGPVMIKQGPSKKVEAPKKKPAEITWENEKQKKECQAYLGELREALRKTRHYSTQGEPCGTGKYAKAFLASMDLCKAKCPKGFLEKNGYTARVIENVKRLHILGTQRCPDLD